MRQCSIKSCRASNLGGVMIHSMPKHRLLEWEKVIKIHHPDHKVTKHFLICENHFTYEDYNISITDGKRTLCKNAVPSVFTTNEINQSTVDVVNDSLFQDSWLKANITPNVSNSCIDLTTDDELDNASFQNPQTKTNIVPEGSTYFMETSTANVVDSLFYQNLDQKAIFMPKNGSSDVIDNGLFRNLDTKTNSMPKSSSCVNLPRFDLFFNKPFKSPVTYTNTRPTSFTSYMEPSTVDIVNNASSKNSSSKEYTPISSISYMNATNVDKIDNAYHNPGLNENILPKSLISSLQHSTDDVVNNSSYKNYGTKTSNAVKSSSQYIDLSTVDVNYYTPSQKLSSKKRFTPKGFLSFDEIGSAYFQGSDINENMPKGCKVPKLTDMERSTVDVISIESSQKHKKKKKSIPSKSSISCINLSTVDVDDNASFLNLDINKNVPNKSTSYVKLSSVDNVSFQNHDAETNVMPKRYFSFDVMDNTSFQSLNSKIISIPKDLSSCMEPSNVVLSDISIPNLGTDAIIMSNSTSHVVDTPSISDHGTESNIMPNRSFIDHSSSCEKKSFLELDTMAYHVPMTSSMKRSTSNVIENALFQDHPYTKSNIEDPSIAFPSQSSSLPLSNSASSLATMKFHSSTSFNVAHGMLPADNHTSEDAQTEIEHILGFTLL